MAANLAHQPNSSHQRKPAGWARRAATTGGKKPETYEAKAHGDRPIQHELAGMITAALEVGDNRMVGKLYGPVLAAILRCRDVSVTAELEIQEQTADGRENIDQTAYQLDPTDANARRRVSTIDEEIGLLIRCRLGLCNRHGLR